MAHWSFIGESRTTYESYYRIKAANIKSLEWGWVEVLPCCVHRSSELHSSTTCPDVPTSADMRMEGPPRKTRHINGAFRLSMWLLQQPAMESVHLHPYCKFPTCVQSVQITTHKAAAPIQM